MSLGPTSDDPMSITILKGGCQCGSIRYTIHLPLDFPTEHIKHLFYCHCRSCRRISGSSFLPYLGVNAYQLTVEKGGSLEIMQGKLSTGLESEVTTMKILHITPTATRTFCTGCGSPVGMTYESDPYIVYVTVGSLDDESSKEVLTEEVVKSLGMVIYTDELVTCGDMRTLIGLRRVRGDPFPSDHNWRGWD